MAEVGSVSVSIDGDSSNLEKAVSDAERSLKTLESAAKSAAKVFGAAFLGGGGAIAVLAKVASDAEETGNLIQESFGKDNVKAVKLWAKTTSEAAGRSRNELLEFAGAAQAMLSPMLGSADAAAEMSTQVAELAVDLGSFFNKSDPEALRALQSGLAGQSEPLRKFGVVLTQAELQQFAFSEGIKKSVKNMTEAQKTALRFNFILAKTGQAQGDAARTSESFQNQIKAVSGRIRDLATDIGQALLPTLSTLVGIVRRVLDTFAAFSDDTKASIANALLLGTALSGVGLAASVAAIGLAKVTLALKTLRGVMVASGKALKSFRAALFAIAIPVILIAAIIGSIIVVVGALEKAIGGLASKFKEGFQFIAQKVKQFLGGAADAISNFLSAIGVEVNFGEIFSGLEDLIKDQGQLIGSSFSDGADVFKDAFSGAFDKVGGFVDGLVNKIGTLGDAGEKAAKRTEDGFSKVNLPSGRSGGGKPRKESSFEKGLGKTVQQGLDKINQSNRDRIIKLSNEEFEAREKAAQAAKDRAEESKAKISDFVSGFTDQILGSLGDFGSAISNVANAAAQGGPAAAIAQAAFELVSRTESFKEIVLILNDFFMELVEAVEPLVQALVPVVKILVNVARSLIKPLTAFSEIILALSPIIQLLAQLLLIMSPTFQSMIIGIGILTAVLEALSSALSNISGFLLNVAQTIAGVVNSVIGAFQGLLRKIRDLIDKIPGTGKLQDFLNGAINGLNQFKISIEDATLGAAKSLGCDAAGPSLCEATNSVGESMTSVTSELTNIPSGFKIALARFNAIDPGLTASTAAAQTAGTEDNRTAVSIDSVFVTAEKPEEFLRQLEDASNFNDFTNSGSSQSSGFRPVQFSRTGGGE